MDNVRELHEEARTLERAGRDGAALDLYGRILSDPEGARLGGVWASRARLRIRAGAGSEAAADLAASAERFDAAGRRNLALAQWRASLHADPAGPAERLLGYGRLAAALGYGRDARHGFAEFAGRAEADGDLETAVDALREYLAVFPDDAAMRRRLSELTGEPELATPPSPAPPLPEQDPPDLDAAADAAPLPGLIPTAAEELPDESVPEAHGLPPVGLLEGFEPTVTGVPNGGAAEAETAAADSTSAGDAGPGAGDAISAEGEEAEGEEGPGAEADELPLLDASAFAAGGEPGAADAPERRPGGAPGEEEDDAEPADEASEPLPLLGVGEEPTAGVAAALEDLSAAPPGLERVAAAVGPAEAAPARAPEMGADAAGALELQRRRVEEALRAGDRPALIEAYLALAARLEAELRTEEARGAMARVLELDPENERARSTLGAAAPAAGGDYVDFGAMVLADAPGEETRFQVAIGDPSGDEENDFAEILDLFRRNVSERLDPRDAASHYDLGLAFKQMGLLDDAIIHLQSGLRGGADPLATLEVLGECFVLRGQTSLAARVFDRATRLEGVGEAEQVGVLYGLARCHEELGDRESARETLERVVAVDLSFRDAAERLRRLQSG